MPYGQEIATVLPADQTSPLQTFQWGYEQQQKKKALNEEKQQRLAEQKRTNRLGVERYLDEAFDFDKVKTGLLDQDKLLLNQQQALRQQAEQAAYGNEMSEAELRSMMRSGLMNINAMSQATKTARATVDESLKPYADSKSLDLQRMKDAAYRQTFFDVDPESGVSMQRNVKDIKPADIAEMIDKHPERFVSTDKTSGEIVHGDLDQYIKDQKPTLKAEEVYRDYKLKGGRVETKKEKLAVMKLLGQEIKWGKSKDKDGNEIDTPELRFKTETTLDENKKPVEMLNSDSYNQYFGSTGARAALQAETNRRNKGREIDYSTAQGQRELRKTALDLLNKRATGTSVSYAEEKILSALPRVAGEGGGGGSSETKKEKTILEKEKDTPVYSMMDKGNLSTDPKDSEGLRRVTPYLPGGSLMSRKIESKEGGGTASTQAYADVFLDDKNNYWVKDDKGSQARMIKPTEEYGFLKRIAEANGMSVKNFNTHWQETHPKSNLKNVQKDLEVAQEQRSDALNKFVTTGGDPAPFLKDFKGEHFVLTTKKGDVEEDVRVQLRDLTKKGDKYIVTFKYPDGKVKAMSPQTLAELKTKLSKHDY
jgi:hypothetical protein